MADPLPPSPGIMLIEKSVGEGGANKRQDTATVQVLLNRVRARVGTPKDQLHVDGIVGPKTIGAIKEFQKKFVQELKRVDGRVDPNQVTILKLNIVAGNLPPLNNGVAYHRPKAGVSAMG